MSASTAVQAKSQSGLSPARRISSFLFPKPKLRLALLLAAPLTWLVLIYIVALVALLITAFWSVDTFTGEIQMTGSLDNIQSVFTQALYRTVTFRTLGIAILVTIVDILIALPIAFYMAKVASKSFQRVLVIMILMPLWASYLVKAYAWRSVLSNKGVLEWVLAPLGLNTPGYSLLGAAITLGYMWLPYVILPIYGGLEKVPGNLLEASSDLGAKTLSLIHI